MKLAVRDQHEMVLKLYLATPPPYEISRITDADLFGSVSGQGCSRDIVKSGMAPTT